MTAPRYPSWREMRWERRAVELQARKATELARRFPPRYPCLGDLACANNREARHAAAKKREHAKLFVDEFVAALDAYFYPPIKPPTCPRCGCDELVHDTARLLYWCSPCNSLVTELAVELGKW